MRDLNGRVERLERRIAPPEGGMIILTVPYGEDAAQAQEKALEAHGLRPSDIGGRQVVFVTSFANA